jgi:hypothetical protein
LPGVGRSVKRGPRRWSPEYDRGAVGDPDALMDDHFDAMVYVANWGTHTLRLRGLRRRVRRRA